MSGAPSPFVNSFQEPSLGSLRYNTSQAGSPLPIIYGTQRVSINLLEFWGFKGSSAKGGKGGPQGKSGGKKSATFSVYVAMAVCQGPVSFTGASHGVGGNNRIWANAGINYGIAAVGLNAFVGNDGQAPDSTFAASDPNTPVLGYSGTAYLTGDPLQLGQSPAIPNVSFETTGFEAGTCGPLFPDDANPSLIIQDFLTNLRYGAGFPSSAIDSTTFTAFGNYCQAASLAVSKILSRCEPASRLIEEICQVTVSAPFFSGGVLKIVPYTTSSYPTFNGASYTPDLTPQYSLTDRDFIDWGGESDPVIVTINDHTQITNWFAIEYLDSSNAYNNNIAYTFDQGEIDAYGLRNEAPSDGHLFTNLSSATVSAQLQLERKRLIRRTVKFQLGWTFCLLDPMDIVLLTDVSAGLNNTPFRITSIEENDNNELSFLAEELPAISTLIPLNALSVPTSQVPNVQVDPGNANAPIIFEPNPPLSDGSNTVWILSSGGANFGGANVFVSTDGTTYQFVGALYAGARQGLTTASLAAFGGANPDNTHTLSVNLAQSLGTLVSASASDAANGISLCYVDGELLSYQTATLTSANHYDLTHLYRGLFGTTPGSHSSGATFAYLGLANNPGGVFKYVYPASLIGQTIHVKLQAFNSFFNETQDISGLTSYSYTLTGTGSVVPINVPFSFNGIPQNGVPILNHTFGANFVLPASVLGSACTAGVAATASTTCNIAKNGTVISSLNFAIGATVATFAASAQFSFASGDVLTITPTSTDATLANLTGNIKGVS